MIPCTNPLIQCEERKHELQEAMNNVLLSGNYVLGAEVSKFEKNFAIYTGSAYALGVNSGTDALILTLKALGVGPGDQVITVSLTALATVASIVAVGATPVLVDVDPKYYTMCIRSLKQAIKPSTKAIIPVHLYGQSANIAEILSIASYHDIFVIEDCAQAAGAEFNNKKIGSFGVAGCFSFYPTKNLPSMGDAGMITTDDRRLFEKLKKIRQYGWNENRVANILGVNSRIDELQAAILNVNLPYLDTDNQKRRLIATRYKTLQTKFSVQLPLEMPNSLHVYHLYVVLVDDRAQFIKKLEKNGVFAGIHYKLASHHNSAYKKLCVLPKQGLPHTEYIVKHCVSLPMFPGLQEIDLNQVIDSFRKL